MMGMAVHIFKGWMPGLRVPAAAADGAGAVPRSNPAGAEAVALRALMQGRQPGRARDGCGCGCQAAWTLGRDARLGTIGDGEPARQLCCSPMAVIDWRRKLGIARFVEDS